MNTEEDEFRRIEAEAKMRVEQQAEPTPWRDMVVVSLVREGIDKHRARELADHFAAQRPWQGLTDAEIEQGCKESWVTEQAWQSAVWWAEAALKEKNT